MAPRKKTTTTPAWQKRRSAALDMRCKQRLFIQLSILSANVTTMMNRDDTGMAKVAEFGGYLRDRTSSQNLRYTMRNYRGPDSFEDVGIPESVRSRRIFEDMIAQPLIAEGLPEDMVRTATLAIRAVITGESEKAKRKAAKKAEEGADDACTEQVAAMGPPEITLALDTTRELVQAMQAAPNAKARKALAGTTKDGKAVKAWLGRYQHSNLRASAQAAGTSVLMCGRMVTSDNLARVSGALSTAHRLSTHALSVENDYFTAADSLLSVGGSGHINSQQLTSGLGYSYQVMDIGQLVSNITGCKPTEWKQAEHDLAQHLVHNWIQISAKVFSQTKKGSAPAFTHADMVMVEVGYEQPRTLMNAWSVPVSPRNVLEGSIRALVDHMRSDDAMYGHTTLRRVASRAHVDLLTGTDGISGLTACTLDELATWAAEQINGR